MRPKEMRSASSRRVLISLLGHLAQFCTNPLKSVLIVGQSRADSSSRSRLHLRKVSIDNRREAWSALTAACSSLASALGSDVHSTSQLSNLRVVLATLRRLERVFSTETQEGRIAKAIVHCSGWHPPRYGARDAFAPHIRTSRQGELDRKLPRAHLHVVQAKDAN